MENKKVAPRSFLFKHKCGSIFTINTDCFWKVPEQQVKANKNVGYKLQCPSCQKTIDEGTIDTFKNFLAVYKRLTSALNTQQFSIREITDQDLSSLVSQ